MQTNLVKIVIYLLTGVTFVPLLYCQPIYNSCNQALELCPGQSFNVSNIDANKTLCPGCEDDFTFCFAPNNSIWLTFTTNDIGGDVDVDFSNLNFEINPNQGTELQASILSASVPCNSASYTQLGNCETTVTTNFVLSATGLSPSSLYYVVISGSLNGAGVTIPAECSFDVSISGTGVDRITPTAAISLSDTDICQNELLTASISLSDCPDTSSFNWFVNGVLVAVTTEPFFQSTSLSDGDIVSVETYCYTLCPIIVSDAASPLAVTSVTLDAGNDLFINYGDTVQLQGTTTTLDFNWSPAFAVSIPTVLNPYVWPLTTTTYTLTATENGCTFSDQVTVFVDPQLNIPNTFSPNDDSINDKWEIEGIELYPDCYIRIFDRWGQEVFQSTGYSSEKAWDGNSRSAKLSEGVYFYILDLRDAEKNRYEGSISLIR